ncbi:MAG: phosphoribosylamine--glycine ligase [Bacteroidia bacterium]|nr:phosphoribosylamine--glycine ligase [Bacteroidia bacterium]
MKVLLLGGGGREHALAWALAQSPQLTRLYCAPGNPGTAELGENVALTPTDPAAVVAFARAEAVELVVVGPEAPLVAGVADALRAVGIAVVGPGQQGAALEGSKRFAKGFLQRHGIPTAAYADFVAGQATQAEAFLDTLAPPYVIKADGLAAGKGVVIAATRAEAQAAVHDFLTEGKLGEAGRTVVIEAFLPGIEVSVFVLTDGEDYVLLPEAKDYKRIGEGDTGPNTGGMGAVSPVPFYSDTLRARVVAEVVEPTLRGLQAEGIPYRGFLFIGLMVVGGVPYVLEYNVRLGDPETQAILPRLEGDLLAVLHATALGRLSAAREQVRVAPHTSAAVVCASPGYPESSTSGLEITLPDLPAARIFHAGTGQVGGRLVTAGGRVLAVAATAPTLAEAVARAVAGAEAVQYTGRYYRRDIGADVLPR